MKQPSLPARAARESPSPAEGRGAGADTIPPPSAGEGQAARSAARERGRRIAKQRGRAKTMRRSATPAEHRLWQILRAHRFAQYKFRRQVPIDHYIVDLLCPAERLIIELDGGQHSDNAHDLRRDAYLRAQGFRILRIWNTDLFENEEGTLTAIANALAPPLPNPSPARGEGLKDTSHA